MLFELVRAHRRVLHLQQLPVSLFADELAVLLQPGQVGDPLPDLLVGRRDAEPRGLGERGLLLDHLLDDALVDAELLEQSLVDVAAVGGAVRLHLLLVGAPEAGRR